MGLELIFAIVAFVTAAASAAYQVIQAKKMKQKALEAAEARKGFEIVTEGEPGYVPIVYGRALIGGKRVWHATTSNYTHVTTNSDKSFLTGNPRTTGYTYIYSIFTRIVNVINHYAVTTQTGTVGTRSSGYLDKNLTGTRNEFLFLQQAICASPIQAVYDVIVDGSRNLDDASLGTFGRIEETASEKEHIGVKAALRLDYHYKGFINDAIASANFAERADSVFSDVAYLSGVFRIDRDDPQFSGPPSIQSIVEGRLVRAVSGGVISSVVPYKDNPAGYAYSNNPSWCLLDYLLDTVHGRGLALDEIDLPSFEAAAIICDTIVQSGIHVGGKIWRPIDTSRTVTLRDLPLYECNAIIDTERPFRENIESLLSCMGDARIVWSGGKYRLSMQYPATNLAIALAGEITDEDLILDETIGIELPTAQSKYNHVMVKFHNEFENFTEDSVSWPPKYDGTYTIGIGGRRYSAGSGSWGDDKIGGRLLNAYSVWTDGDTYSNLTYKMKVNKEDAGVYSIQYVGDDNISVTIQEFGGATIFTGSRTTAWSTGIGSTSVSLGSPSVDKIYIISVNGTDTTSLSSDTRYRGLAVKISNSSRVLWTTRDVTYDDFVVQTRSKAVYTTMLTEDNGVELETTLFAEGITDPYHALAKAEELVRTSRTSSRLKATMIVKSKFYQPGDFVKFRSDAYNIGVSTPFYGRVEASKVKNDDQCALEISRFDYTQLAWNIKDDVYISTPTVYGFFVPQPTTISYTVPGVANGANSSGSIACTPVSLPELGGYIWYVHKAGIDELDADGFPVFLELGRTAAPYFELGRIEAASAFFGVKAFTSNGKQSRMTTTAYDVAVILQHNWLKQVVITSTSNTFLENADPILLVATSYNIVAPTYKWYVEGVEQAGYTINLYNLTKFTNTNQKEVKVVVYEASTGTTYEDVVDIGYIASGTDGYYVDVRFHRSYAQPPTPAGLDPLGWYNAVPTGDETIWLSSVLRVAATNALVDNWSVPQALQSLVPRGAYDNTATYYQLNVVTYNSNSYIATVNNFSGHPPSGTDQPNAYWDVLAATGGGAPATPPTPPVSTINVTTSTQTVNLRTLADAAGYTGFSDATYIFNINGDVTGLGGDPGQIGGHGIDTGTWPFIDYAISITVNLASNVFVCGGGGGGGQSNDGSGGPGGDAIYCRLPIVVTNLGYIAGGGGGGGAGKYAPLISGNIYGGPCESGAGGGGAPNGKGGLSPTSNKYQSSVEATNGARFTGSGGYVHSPQIEVWKDSSYANTYGIFKRDVINLETYNLGDKISSAKTIGTWRMFIDDSYNGTSDDINGDYPDLYPIGHVLHDKVSSMKLISGTSLGGIGGIGGKSIWSANSYKAGNGGDGGKIGANGVIGGNAVLVLNGTTTNITVTATFGLAGYAIRKNGHTVTTPGGTIYGTVG